MLVPSACEESPEDVVLSPSAWELVPEAFTNLFPFVTDPDTLKFPFTSNVDDGVVVPIPTLPPASIITFCEPLVLNLIGPALSFETNRSVPL